ncbi:MAG: HAMP domain-containing sensor histidine kinase [Salibacteraceae bacterium]
MTLLMVFSLLVIGAVTVFFFKSQNDIYHQERLARKERSIKTEMMYFSKEVETQDGEDVVIREFEQELLRLSDVHRMEINIFNVKGQMLVSARPGEIHSEYMDRTVPDDALEELRQENRVVIPEYRDGHEYLSDYTVLKNAKSEPIAILNLPYRQDESVNQNDLPEFLGSISITYLFLFMAAIALTIVLSNSITKNLSVVSQKMQSVDLTKPNEPVLLNRDYEIVALVKSYKLMLEKLAESRDLLAKTEREGAWREMARQVAHEIKNPLTPIKLSVQHLQATSNFESSEWQDKFRTTMEMIIQQTESLSRIASEFSDFAKLHDGNLQRVNMVEAINDTAVLFSDIPAKIEVKSDGDAHWVMVDPDAIRRVLNNLVKNAKQALKETENPTITMTSTQVDDRIIVTISDNGSGVSKDSVDRIFQPNFTTKTSGTGLGLAICQQIVEQAGGKIWLDNNSENGATFRFEIPAVA